KPQRKRPPLSGWPSDSGVCLTMSYFHGRLPTIIGARAFHGPVRDGKGWFHSAMVVRHDLLAARLRWKTHDPIRQQSTCDCTNEFNSFPRNQAAVLFERKLDLAKL